MRVVLAAMSLCLLSVIPATTQQERRVTSTEQNNTLSVNVDLVNVLATVADKHGHMVTNLTKNDFRLFEDGEPQEISHFNKETELPLNIALAVDTSGSVRDTLPFEKQATTEFLQATLRRDIDQALLMSFDSDINVIQDYTGDSVVLERAARAMMAGGGTKLYDAISLASSRKLANRQGRRLVILISDGEDNCSRTSLSHALEVAQRNNVTIYAISTNWLDPLQQKEETQGDRSLRQLASATGGRIFCPRRPQDLTHSFQAITQELRAQYSLAYHSTNPARDGAFRRIRIEVVPRYCQVRTREGYFAPRPAG